MSRPKMKPAPAPWFELGMITDSSCFQQFTSEITKRWRTSGPTTEPLSPDALIGLTFHCVAYAARPEDRDKLNLAPAARAAIKTLLRWCRLGTNDLPRLMSLDSLEAKLLEEFERADLPARAWVLPAFHIWTRAAAISGVRGVSPTSHAVRFTSSVLQWLGYPSATANAVSKEVRSWVREELQQQAEVSNDQCK